MDVLSAFLTKDVQRVKKGSVNVRPAWVPAAIGIVVLPTRTKESQTRRREKR